MSRHVLALLLLLLPGTAIGEDVLRVGTSGDYAPFSRTTPDGELAGFDLEVARRFAESEGFELVLVRFTWAELLHDLGAGRFDVAMGGITVRPERSAAGRFSAPVATSGAMALVREDSPYRSVDELGLPGTRLVVNAGGHLERVARARFPRATLITLPDNAGVLAPLLQGSVDAAVTDDREAPVWQAEHPELRALGPFSRDLKAYLVRPERGELAARLDAWLFDEEQRGRLAELRKEHLGTEEELATPLRALLAALDERLDLMPLVAEAKRARELPVRAPEREAEVIEAAVQAARVAAERAGTPALPDRWVRALFRAQIEAAVAVQEAVLARAADPAAASFDLDGELRPALLRLGERISDYLVRLPGPLDPGRVQHQAEEELDAPGLEPGHVFKIADSIAQISRYR